jgi:hypothetical protein
MRCDYLEIARWVGNGRPKAPEHPVVSNSRDHVGTEPFPLFALAGFSAKGRYEGFCNKGMDYWTYTTAGGQKRGALNSYMTFGNVIGSTPRALSAPGPDGAMRTPVTEMVREGTQVQEAVYRIQDNLNALYPPPMQQCDMAEIFLKDALRQPDATPGKNGNLGAELEVNFVFDGADVRVLPMAPRWNTSGIGKGTALVSHVRKDGATFSFDFSLGDDPWVKGGSGHFDVTVALKDGEYTGTYTGQWKGVESAGPVRGDYQPKGYTMSAGPAPAKNALQIRCDEAIREFHDAVNLDARGGSPLRAEMRRLVTRLYALAEETTALVGGKR